MGFGRVCVDVDLFILHAVPGRSAAGVLLCSLKKGTWLTWTKGSRLPRSRVTPIFFGGDLFARMRQHPKPFRHADVYTIGHFPHDREPSWFAANARKIQVCGMVFPPHAPRLDTYTALARFVRVYTSRRLESRVIVNPYARSQAEMVPDRWLLDHAYGTDRKRILVTPVYAGGIFALLRAEGLSFAGLVKSANAIAQCSYEGVAPLALLVEQALRSRAGRKNTYIFFEIFALLDAVRSIQGDAAFESSVMALEDLPRGSHLPEVARRALASIEAHVARYRSSAMENAERAYERAVEEAIRVGADRRLLEVDLGDRSQVPADPFHVVVCAWREAVPLHARVMVHWRVRPDSPRRTVIYSRPGCSSVRPILGLSQAFVKNERVPERVLCPIDMFNADIRDAGEILRHREALYEDLPDL